jgi:hypothetical protein
MSTLLNWLLLICVSLAGIIMLGLWVRLVVLLFCFGYGC